MSTETEASALTLDEFFDRSNSLVTHFQNACRVRVQEFTGRRQFMVVSFGAVKENHAHLFFQLAQRNTNRRRSATDALCGPANISCLHHSSEHFQLLKFHRLLLDQEIRSVQLSAGINSKRPSSL